MLRYGITEEDFDSLVELQDGGCAICKQIPKRLVVDHCHESGKIRGLLCDPCNVILGRWMDDPEIPIRAAAYLRKGGA